MELLTVDVTTLADGQGTRYRAEVNLKLPGLDSLTPEDVKKTIDTVIADPRRLLPSRARRSHWG